MWSANDASKIGKAIIPWVGCVIRKDQAPVLTRLGNSLFLVSGSERLRPAGLGLLTAARDRKRVGFDGLGDH